MSFFQNVPTWRGISGFPSACCGDGHWCTIRGARGTLQKTPSRAVKAGHEDTCLLCTAFTGSFSRSLCLQRFLLEERGVRRCGRMAGGSRELFHPHPGAASLLQAPWVAVKTQRVYFKSTPATQLGCQCAVLLQWHPRSAPLLLGSSRTIISGSPHLPWRPCAHCQTLGWHAGLGVLYGCPLRGVWKVSGVSLHFGCAGVTLSCVW